MATRWTLRRFNSPKNDFTRSAPEFRHYKLSHRQQVKGCELLRLMKYERAWPGLVEPIRNIHLPSSPELHPSQRGDWYRFIGSCLPKFLPWKFWRTASSGPLCFSASCLAGKSAGAKSSATFARDAAHFFVSAAALWSA